MSYYQFIPNLYPTIRTSKFSAGNQWDAENPYNTRALKYSYRHKLILKKKKVKFSAVYNETKREIVENYRYNFYMNKFSFTKIEIRTIKGEILTPLLGEEIYYNRN
jgi:hypothetical protein